ncbi:MAG TPA: hypothetical protein EYO73_09375 [Sulfurimonas sp.]|nr:hypothetical protein [Sulfurimonas sp.]
MFKLFLLSFILFLCLGCSNHSKIPSVIEPLWLYKPNLNGKTGAVGSSRPQFKGKTVQRRVAVSRALDELAQQNGVEVGNIIMRKEKSSAISASSKTIIESTQTSSGSIINAHIEEVWVDPKTKEMYIWLIAD